MMKDNDDTSKMGKMFEEVVFIKEVKLFYWRLDFYMQPPHSPHYM
jgi:hypothetical protein